MDTDEHGGEADAAAVHRLGLDRWYMAGYVDVIVCATVVGKTCEPQINTNGGVVYLLSWSESRPGEAQVAQCQCDDLRDGELAVKPIRFPELHRQIFS